MSDRILLELAAQAIGLKGHAVPFSPGDHWHFIRTEERPLVWSPLHEDGAALRLAVDLAIAVAIYDDPVNETHAHCVPITAIEKHRNDAYAATRRAIVRAAAAIGGLGCEGKA